MTLQSRCTASNKPLQILYGNQGVKITSEAGHVSILAACPMMSTGQLEAVGTANYHCVLQKKQLLLENLQNAHR